MRILKLFICLAVLSGLDGPCQYVLGQTISPVDAEKFRDLTMPFDSKLVTYFFGKANPPTGEELTLSATGSILINLNRGTDQLVGGASVTIGVKTTSGITLASWTTEIKSVKSHKFIRQIEVPLNASVVFVRVIDSAEGGPTGERPYTLYVEAWPLTEKSSVQLSSDALKRMHAESSVASAPSCRLVSHRATRSDYIESFLDISLDSVPQEVSIQYLVTAGNYLSIDLFPLLAPSDSVAVRILAKPLGDGPFKEVCPYTVIERTKNAILEAELQGLDEKSVWRIEPRITHKLSSEGRKSRLRLSRKRSLAGLDPSRTSYWWNNARGLVCYDRLTPFLIDSSSDERFGGRTRLNVTVPSAGSIPLTEAQREAAELIIMQAASLWVHSCLTCKPDNLAVLSINGKVFVAEGLYMSLGLSNPLRMEPSEAEAFIKSSVGSARVGVPVPFQPYRLVQNPKTDFRHLCSLELSASKTPIVKRVQEAICAQRPDYSIASDISMSFKKRNTACGSDPDVIGCWADEELTQYNVLDYRFAAQPSGTVIGEGPYELDLLQAVLHEMGHWIGLAHVDATESIMASTLEHARCIDFETVKSMVRGAVSANSERQRTTPQSFRLKGQRINQ